jgi:hypothetical protein
MSANHVGKVAIFDVAGTLTLTGSGMLATDEMAKKSASLTSASTPVDLTVGGQVIRRSYTNKNRTISVTFVPYDPDAPGSLSGLKAKVKLPAEGSTVTLADFDSPDFNGDWNLESGTINTNEAQYLSMTVNLSRVGYASGAPVALAPQT